MDVTWSISFTNCSQGGVSSHPTGCSGVQVPSFLPEALASILLKRSQKEASERASLSVGH